MFPRTKLPGHVLPGHIFPGQVGLHLFRSLRSCASYEVQVLSRFLARDVQSVTGKNLTLLKEVSSLNPWTTKQCQLRNALIAAELVEVPFVDQWRLPYLWSLLAQKSQANSSVLEKQESRLEGLINSLVRN